MKISSKNVHFSLRSAHNPHTGRSEAILRGVQGGGAPLVGGLGGEAPQLDARRTSWKIYRRSINPPSFNPSIIHQSSINHPSTILRSSFYGYLYIYGYLWMSMDVASMENRKVGLCPRDIEIRNLPKHPLPPSCLNIPWRPIEILCFLTPSKWGCCCLGKGGRQGMFRQGKIGGDAETSPPPLMTPLSDGEQ